MINDGIEKLEYFLWDSFKEDVCLRELRLSNQEMEYLKEKYPKAIFKLMPTEESTDGKVWYEVTLY